MKELMKLMLGAIVVSGIFLGLVMFSNYLHYGTFLF